ncbi:MAG: pilus assembly protein PilM [Bdellovibrionales bacterium]|nr:pilus assembly protein PilM [Bdellovibrionales bacterium]
MFFGKKKLILDIDSNIIKAGVFLNTSKSSKLLDYSTASVNQAGSVSQAILMAVNNLSSKFKKANVAIGGREVFIQHIVLNKTPQEQWPEQIMAEAETYVPYEISSVNINYVNLNSVDSDKNEFLLIATPRQLIAQVQQDCLDAGIQCESMESAVISLANGFEYNYGILRDQNIAVLEVREDRTSFIGILNGKIYFVKNIDFGLSNYDQALSDQLQLSIAEAESLRKNFCLNKEVPQGTAEIVNSLHDSLQSELTTATQFIKEVLLKEPPTNLFLTGSATCLPNLAQRISDIIACEPINIFLNTQYDEQKIKKLDIEEVNPIGAALVGLGSNF